MVWTLRPISYTDLQGEATTRTVFECHGFDSKLDLTTEIVLQKHFPAPLRQLDTQYGD